MPSGDGGGAVAVRNTTITMNEWKWVRMGFQFSMHMKKEKNGKQGNASAVRFGAALRRYHDAIRSFPRKRLGLDSK